MDGEKGYKFKIEASADVDEEKQDDRATHDDVSKSFDVDASNSVRENQASFLNIYPDIKRIIFKKLDIGSRYNLSLVWEDMTEEFWDKVDVNRRMIHIESIEELEYAGVLATGGYIDTVENLCLQDVDVSSIPINIINNVVKIVKICIDLEAVAGWSTSLLNDAKCRDLFIENMDLRSETY